MIVSSTGQLLFNYRKTFLYETDKNWACEGSSFATFDLPDPIGRLGLGICMDCNPKDFVAPFEAFEFANFQKSQSPDLVILCCNWLDSARQSSNPLPTINYWLKRLTPLIGTRSYFAVCNRTGDEKDAIFCGSSCFIDLKYPSLLGNLGKKDQGLLCCSIDRVK